MNYCDACRDGDGWVCENHPELAWPIKCDCGAGMPCPQCYKDE